MKRLGLKSSAVFLFVACATTAGAAGINLNLQIPPDPPQPASIAGHLAKARQIAGNNPALQNLATKGYWCMSPAVGGKYIGSQSTEPAPPLQLFDNLYLIGTGFVSSIVLKTSDGLVVWDALDNADEARTILIPGLKHFGLDPKDIKLLIITHGHFDHFGGAKYMQDTYHTPIALSGPDWDMMLSKPASDPSMRGVTPPKKDKVLTDGQKITIGDATIQIVLTPGHTPATVSSIVPVKDHGVTRTMAMWGGTAYPQGPALQQMGTSMLKLRDATIKAGASGVIGTHAFFYDIPQKFTNRDPNGPNPLVVGTETAAKSFDIEAECLKAMQDWRAAMAKS